MNVKFDMIEFSGHDWIKRHVSFTKEFLLSCWLEGKPRVLTGVGDDRIGRAMAQRKGLVNSISGNRVNSQVHEGKFEIVLCYTLDGIRGENSAQRDGFRLYMRFSAEARPVRISKNHGKSSSQISVEV